MGIAVELTKMPNAYPNNQKMPSKYRKYFAHPANIVDTVITPVITDKYEKMSGNIGK